MLYYSNAKINLGLRIVAKRPDGFHNIETVFCPIPIQDALEFVPSSKTSIEYSGIPVNCDLESNLIIKAFRLLQKDFQLPELSFVLHKIIPYGAGLGGGSANASYTLIALNRFFDLGLTDADLIAYANQLGSDCAFFIRNTPVYATDKGTVFEDVNLNLSQKHITLVYPNFGISTQEAYSGITPQKNGHFIPDILNRPIKEWKPLLINDFEKHLFVKYPVLSDIKNHLYRLGADYVAMSGSGSTIFAISEKLIDIEDIRFWKWQGKL